MKLTKLLGNKDTRDSFYGFFFLSVIAIILTTIQEIQFGIFTMIFSILLWFIHFRTMEKRYEKIMELSESINGILHGEDEILVETYEEGELGILQSELSKMTICLREQKKQLQEDKIYLTNSIADLSHQIRTPLTSIQLIVSFLSEEELTWQRRMELVGDLRGLLSKIDWMVTALLKISRLDTGTVAFKKEKTTLEQLLNQALMPIFVPMELRNQTLEISAKGDFTGDIAWTSEALLNIAKNCMEHTPESGKIQVVAEETPLYVQIVISDNGPGISKEDFPYIFQRFYKGKNSGTKSFGIGLALARMIITNQSGTIKAENNPSKGASFLIRFYKEII